MIVISGHVVDDARKRRNAGSLQVVRVKAKIADLNCYFNAGRELLNRSRQAIERPMYVTNERKHLRWTQAADCEIETAS